MTDETIDTIEPSTFYEVLKKLLTPAAPESNASGECTLILNSIDKANIVKAKEIVNSYSCFRDENIPAAFAGKFRSGSHHHGGGRVYAPVRGGGGNPLLHHQVRRVAIQPKTLSYIDKVKRETLGILNKIAGSNFNTIVQKLTRYCDEKNCATILEMVLEKCYTHDYYAAYFMKLLEIIHTKHTEHTAEVLYSFKDKVLIELKHELDTIASLDPSDYDQFCMSLMKRRHLVEKHKTLYVLDRLGFAPFGISEYFCELECKIRDATHPDIIDVLINISREFLGMYNECGDEFKARLKDLLDAKRGLCSKKTVFVWEDICV